MSRLRPLSLCLLLLLAPPSSQARSMQAQPQRGTSQARSQVPHRILGDNPFDKLALFLWGGNNQFRRLIDFLEDNGFSTFVEFLKENDLECKVREAVKRGTRITLLVPSNEAFEDLPDCNLDEENVVLNHVIPRYLPGNCLYTAPLGSKVPTFGRDRVEKVSNNPLTVQLKAGVQPINGFADVFDPSQDNQDAVNRGNGFKSNNTNDITNVNNGNINNININGDNNNVNITNINFDKGDDTVCDFGGYDPTINDGDNDSFGAITARVVALDIFKEESIVVHHIDRVLAAC